MPPFLVPVMPSSLLSEQLPSWGEGSRGQKASGPLARCPTFILGTILEVPYPQLSGLSFYAGAQASRISGSVEAMTADTGLPVRRPELGSLERQLPKGQSPPHGQESASDKPSNTTEVRAGGLGTDPMGLIGCLGTTQRPLGALSIVILQASWEGKP